MNRAYFIDNLRIFLTILVIIHHTAIAYGASGGWCYVTPEIITGMPQMALSVMLTINQAFFMSLFFFISAYFMPGSLEKKGIGKFLKDRFIRLGIPLFLTMLLLHPSLNYFIYLYTQPNNPGWLSYVWYNISHYITTAHMWFVLALLIFETVYALYKKYIELPVSVFITDKLPSHLTIALFIGITGILAFVIRMIYPIGGKNFIGLQFGYFTLYCAFYLLGIIANRKKWLTLLSFKMSLTWFIAAVLGVPLIILVWMEIIQNPAQISQYLGGFHLRSLFLSYWEAIVCLGISFFLLKFFQKKLNKTTNLLSSMASGSYFVYFIHAIVLVTFTIVFEQVSIAPFLKFLLNVVCTVTTCFVLASFIRKSALVRKVF